MIHERYDRISAVPSETWDAVPGTLRSSHRWLSVAEESSVGYAPTYVVVREGATPVARWVIARYQAATFVRRSIMKPTMFVEGFGIAPSRSVASIDREIRNVCREVRTPFIAVNVRGDDIEPWRAAGFSAIELKPSTTMVLSAESYERHMETLRRDDRKEIRHVRRRAEKNGLKVVIRPGSSSDAPDYMPLMSNVHARHGVDVRRLYSASVLDSFRRHFRDDMVTVEGYAEGRLVGFVTSIKENGRLVLQFVGLDYEVSRKYFVYFVLVDEVLRWAFEHDVREIDAGFAAYEQKARFGFRKSGRWIVYRANNTYLNKAAARLAPTIEKTFNLNAPPVPAENQA